MKLQIKLSKIPTLPNYTKLFDQKVFKVLAVQVKDDIIKRTKSGIDMYGNQFIPYSQKYAKKKKKTVVDLFDTGQMLGDIQSKSYHSTGIIQIKSSRSKRIASYNQNRLGKQRKFFGLTPQDQSKLHNKIVKIVRNLK